MIFFILFTLSIGSFLNVVIYRLPIMLSLWVPRSFCPFCQTPIPFWHNIPILSYLILRARCHACEHSISVRYLVIEIMTCGLSLYAAYLFPSPIALLFVLPFCWILLCLSVIDMEHQLLPDQLTIGLLWLGLVANTQLHFVNLSDAIYGVVSAYLSLWILLQIYQMIRGRIGMGHGDFKLFAALGAWFGWMALPFILLVASMLGTVYGLIYLTITKKTRDTRIPFGPFLCIAGITYLFFRC